MDKIFTDLKEGPWWTWVAAVTCGGLVLSLFLGNNYTPNGEAGVAWASFGFLVLFIGPTVISAGKLGHKHVPTVCFWVTTLLLAFIVTVYYWYFRWVPAVPTLAHDRVLNIVPVMAAVVAASLGWYVHFQFSSKSQKTNNAFSMVMEMRKSAEFLRRYENVVRHFPVGIGDIPPEYHQFFASGSLKRIYDAAALANGTPNPIEIERAQAIADLKYVLNYYEFIAAGVKANDLDEDMLIDTVSEIVVGLFNRARSLITFIRSPAPQGQGQILAYTCLTTLVGNWEKKIADELAEYHRAKPKQ